MNARLDIEDIRGAAERAAGRIAGTVVHTPLRFYAALSERVGANIRLKLERARESE